LDNVIANRRTNIIDFHSNPVPCRFWLGQIVIIGNGIAVDQRANGVIVEVDAVPDIVLDDVVPYHHIRSIPKFNSSRLKSRADVSVVIIRNCVALNQNSRGRNACTRRGPTTNPFFTICREFTVDYFRSESHANPSRVVQV
jgi:hypothetical protein